MKKTLFLLACGLSTVISPLSMAATTTGSFNATLTLTTGCVINGVPNAANGVDFGSLDFGTSTATFTSINATLRGSQGTGINVLCTTNQPFNVRITSSNEAPGTVFGTVTGQPRYLVLGADASQGIAYTLYNDVALSTPIANNTDLVAAGTPSPTLGQNFPIYGQVTGGNNSSAVPAGTYTDTINVAVNY